MGDLSRAWKYSAKIYRDFYNLTMTQAKEWKGRYYKSQKENQRLRGLLRLFYKNGIHDLEDKRFYTDVGLEEVAAVEKELSDG